jgi:hypothetical protein
MRNVQSVKTAVQAMDALGPLVVILVVAGLIAALA